ncbi:hypothetical protein EYF80_053435 [Liparis tanakae]|uniref:Uncharacterized protein n=1 Tax=Liparis tanakae TaxID=230148 RepID=A0A4Z2F6M6_9TELE|nr:hypothetical protein EYF80_053435 [Liparis tanakae]
MKLPSLCFREHVAYVSVGDDRETEDWRNNGRFPFQLIILLVSRPHCTRTGRGNLTVGTLCKYTWCRAVRRTCYAVTQHQTMIRTMMRTTGRGGGVVSMGGVHSIM